MISNLDIMLKIIPQKLLMQFDSKLNAKGISAKLQKLYRKWLRFYLDFCHKYGHDSKIPDSLPDFIYKLREKNQPKLNQ